MVNNQKLILSIDDVAFGGKGIARLNGKVYFVDGAVAGDVVSVMVTEDKKKYCSARIVEYVQYSPLRKKQSKCKFFPMCGGCQWLDIEYERQLEWKKKFILGALNRIGKINNTLDIQIIPSVRTIYYRSRVLLRAQIKNNTIQIGYFKKSTRELVPIDHCVVAKPSINYFIKHLINSNFRGIQDQKFRIEIQDIPFFSDELNGKIVVGIYPATSNVQVLDAVVDIIKKIDNVLWAATVKDRYINFIFKYEQYNDFIFFAMPFQFQQVNTDQNRIVRDYVLNKVRSYKAKRVLDIFCGGGNFSLPLCKDGIYCEGVEINKNAIMSCKTSLNFNNLSNHNATYLNADAISHLWKCAKKGEVFDVIISDPPREGMYKHIIPISIIFPSLLIYISCNPITLARDIGALIKKGFNLESILAFDFFPQTYHIETVVTLKHIK